MQRLKYYGVTGITNDSCYDEKVFEVYKQVVNDLYYGHQNVNLVL
ncbi:hypothetical protein [Lactobacillus iners]|nr:hypothetical protein [Lactobacillus iners]